MYSPGQKVVRYIKENMTTNYNGTPTSWSNKQKLQMMALYASEREYQFKELFNDVLCDTGMSVINNLLNNTQNAEAGEIIRLAIFEKLADEIDTCEEVCQAVQAEYERENIRMIRRYGADWEACHV